MKRTCKILIEILKDSWSISKIYITLNVLFGFISGIIDSFKIVLIFLILPYIGILLPNSLVPVESFFIRILTVLGFQSNVVSLSVLIFIFLLLSSLVSFYTSWLQATLSQKYSLALRLKLLDSIANAYWVYLRRNKNSDFNAALTVEASKAQSALIKILFSINNFLMALTYFVFSLFLAPDATGVIVLSGASIFLINILITKKLLKRSQQIMLENLNLFARSGEFLHNLKILKATNSVEMVVRRTKDIFHQIFINERFRYLVPDIAKNISENFSIVALLLAICGVAFLGSNNVQTNVLLSLTLFMRVSSKINQMLNYFQQALIESPAIEFIKKILSDSLSCKEFKDVKRIYPEEVDSGIQLNNVKIKHDDHIILENVTCILRPGFLNVFMGSSGSGKTTLVDTLLGMNPLASGNITIGHQSFKDPYFLSLRQLASYVTQDTTLFDVTIAENIKFFMPEASEESVFKAAKLAGAHDFISTLPHGYETKINNSGVNLSGGQKQRISLARALIKNPKVLILDEATSALDPDTEAEIMLTIRQLAKQTTVIFISHKKQILHSEDVVFNFKNKTIEH